MSLSRKCIIVNLLVTGLINVSADFLACLQNLQDRSLGECLDASLECLQNLDIGQVCDGLKVECKSGFDESRTLCEDKRWMNIPCQDNGGLKLLNFKL